MPWLEPCPSPADYERIGADKSRFLPGLGEIARRVGVPPPRAEDLYRGSDVVAAAGPDHVIKAVAPPFTGDLEREVAALRAIRLRIPTPEVIEVGELDGWRYAIISRMPGLPVSEHRQTLSDDGLCELVAEVARVLVDLHAQPAPASFPSVAWSSYVETHRAGLPARLRRWEVPTSYIDAMVVWLDAAFRQHPDLIHPPQVNLIHADLHGGNLLGQPGSDGQQITLSALLDFGDARLGPPLFDLVTPAVFFGRGRRRVLNALYETYGEHVDDAFFHRLMALSLLHPFNNPMRWCRFADVDINAFAPNPDGIGALARRLLSGVD